MSVRRPGVIVPLVLASAAVLGQEQTAPPQFKTGVELIQVDVAVLDEKREPVRGLTAADFTVFEDGAARPIRAFTPVELATPARSSEPVWSDAAPRDVATNKIGEQEGRLVIILMDRSIPLQQPTIVARRVAAAAVEALGPHDLAAVVSTSNGAVQNLTADRTRLLRAINSGDPSTGISPEQEVIFGKLDPLSDGRCLCGLCVLQTIQRVAEAVQDTPRRRKVLLFIGSNVIWQSFRPVSQAGADTGCETPLKDARNAMFAAVDRANLTVHSIDPQGLGNTGPQTRSGARGGFDGGPAARLQQQQTDTNDRLTGQLNLRVLPDRTGGRTVVGANQPDAAVPAILRESEAYYVIGFERGPSDRRDAVRSIEVKVGRRGVRVHAQRHYVLPPDPNGGAIAASSTRPATAGDALTRLLPSAGKTLAMAVAAEAGPDGGKAVARVNVDARAFARTDGTPVPLDVSVIAADKTGKLVASARQTSTVSAGPFVAGRDDLMDVNVRSHLELAPGDYEVRAAVADPASGSVASVFSNVTIPEFASAPLSLSGVSVDIAATAAGAPVASTRRTFRRGERVRAQLQIYQGTARTEPIVPVSTRVQILDAKGGAVRDQSLAFTEQTFTNRRADCTITLPLASLPAGEYLLKLEASVPRQTVARTLRFAVE